MKQELTFNERMQAYAESANEYFRQGRNRLGAKWAQKGFDAWVKEANA